MSFVEHVLHADEGWFVRHQHRFSQRMPRRLSGVLILLDRDDGDILTAKIPTLLHEEENVKSIGRVGRRHSAHENVGCTHVCRREILFAGLGGREDIACGALAKGRDGICDHVSLLSAAISGASAGAVIRVGAFIASCLVAFLLHRKRCNKDEVHHH